jgi:hypothetical protein
MTDFKTFQIVTGYGYVQEVARSCRLQKAGIPSPLQLTRSPAALPVASPC